MFYYYVKRLGWSEIEHSRELLPEYVVSCRALLGAPFQHSLAASIDATGIYREVLNLVFLTDGSDMLCN
jgi:hypothetical protein